MNLNSGLQAEGLVSTADEAHSLKGAKDAAEAAAASVVASATVAEEVAASPAARKPEADDGCAVM